MMDRFVSEALKSMRQYYRLTQAQLAEELETSKSAVSDIETGNKPVSLNTVQRYADWAGVSVSDIFVLAEAYRRREANPSPANLVLRVYEWFNAERTGGAKSKRASSDDATAAGDDGDDPSFDSCSSSPELVGGGHPGGGSGQPTGTATSGVLNC